MRYRYGQDQDLSAEATGDGLGMNLEERSVLWSFKGIPMWKNGQTGIYPPLNPNRSQSLNISQTKDSHGLRVMKQYLKSLVVCIQPTKETLFAPTALICPHKKH